MRFTYLITLLLFFAPTDTKADERNVFYGTWGTVKQCSNEPVKQGGTLLSEPIEISRNWFRQGNVWCSLSWGPIENRATGKFAAANAQCGEDTVRVYFLGMELYDSKLTMRWNFAQRSSPLMRCPDL